MPQGPSRDNSKCINQHLDGLGSFAMAYIDDIAIYSNYWEEHVEQIATVLQRLQDSGLILKAKKCHSGQQDLGHQVGKGKIRFTPCKVEKQVQSLLGLTGYYHRFVPQYSEIAAPLTELTKKLTPNTVKWPEECQKAFEQLQDALITSPFYWLQILRFCS